MEIESASLNGGFGKAYRMSRADLLADPGVAESLAAGEQPAIDHMNADHSDAIDAYARAFASAREDGWVMTGIDPEGVDIALGDISRRIFFDRSLASAAELRPVLVALAKSARQKLLPLGQAEIGGS